MLRKRHSAHTGCVLRQSASDGCKVTGQGPKVGYPHAGDSQRRAQLRPGDPGFERDIPVGGIDFDDSVKTLCIENDRLIVQRNMATGLAAMTIAATCSAVVGLTTAIATAPGSSEKSREKNCRCATSVRTASAPTISRSLGIKSTAGRVAGVAPAAALPASTVVIPVSSVDRISCR
jgi:hypothetical protein